MPTFSISHIVKKLEYLKIVFPRQMDLGELRVGVGLLVMLRGPLLTAEIKASTSRSHLQEELPLWNVSFLLLGFACEQPTAAERGSRLDRTVWFLLMFTGPEARMLLRIGPYLKPWNCVST
ncbi:hypothetical protein PM082_018550 [Marasmius tenuissimus]|nr:hypothetical protein PM082_018550 [Marasmius tenuissimus]